jgi:hypothetical protein
MIGKGETSESSTLKTRPTNGVLSCLHQKHQDRLAKVAELQFIESTAGQVADEFARRGIAPDRHLTITIEPDDWLAEVRRYARPKVIEAGWSDDDIDRLIKQAQKEVNPLLPG